MGLLSEALSLGLDKEKTMFLFSAVQRGLSGNKAIELLKRSPLGGLRRKRAQAIIRVAKSAIKSRKYISSVGNEKRFNPGRLTKSPYHHRRNFNYIIRIDGVSNLTGERVRKNITVATDHQISKNEAIAYAMENIGMEDYEIMDNPEAVVTDILLGGEYLA